MIPTAGSAVHGLPTWPAQDNFPGSLGVVLDHAEAWDHAACACDGCTASLSISCMHLAEGARTKAMFLYATCQLCGKKA